MSSKPSRKDNTKNSEYEASEHSPDVPNTGAYLRRLRKDKGLSIQEVSQTTRISITNLQAIENRDYTALPADTFTRGFLTIYAKYLGADSARVTSDFMQERDESLVQGKQARLRQPRHTYSAKKLAEPSHISSITMAGILLFIILAVLLGLTLFTSWKPFDFLAPENSSIPQIMMELTPHTQQEEQAVPADVPSAVTGADTTPVSPDSRLIPAGQDG